MDFGKLTMQGTMAASAYPPINLNTGFHEGVNFPPSQEISNPGIESSFTQNYGTSGIDFTNIGANKAGSRAIVDLRAGRDVGMQAIVNTPTSGLDGSSYPPETCEKLFTYY